MPSKSLEIDSLKIFTLNCWGLRYISDHRQVRMKLIAQHLCEHDYDIVFLQEVWIQSDFEYIRTKTNSKYKFAHIFNNASILGTSGLVILAKWIPALIHFHPYTINGSPFRPLHGDWFSTKGVAYVRIELIGLNLHLFCTHMHAQYDEREKLIDQYSVHRICQAYELGKFMNLMSCNCTNTASRDLIVMAGDLNTCSKELPYRLLTELTDLSDCYKNDDNNKIKKFKIKDNNNQSPPHSKRIEQLKLEEMTDDDSSDEELTTCGHRENTFTPQQNLKEKKNGKRIDFIFYKLKNSNCSGGHNNENGLQQQSSKGGQNLQCVSEKISVVAKDVSGLSFSDHEPVVSRLLFNWSSSLSLKSSDITPDCNEVSVDTNNSSNNNGINQTKQFVANQAMMKSKKRSDRGELSKKHFSDLSQSPRNCLLIHEIENLLTAYIEKYRPSVRYSMISLIAIVIICILIIVALRLTINLTLTEAFLMSIIFTIISTVALLLKFITHRTEMNAVKAILNDISKKRTFHSDYDNLEMKSRL